MRRVLLHGATMGANFGDVLFASLFYDALSKCDDIDVVFVEMPLYGVGSFVRKEVSYDCHIGFREMFRSDILIYISGGYLGDASKSLKEQVSRWFRYALIGVLMKHRKKRIAFLGVGGGPLYSPWIRRSFTSLLQYAGTVCVREEQTKAYFVEEGVPEAHIRVTTDTALVITRAMVEQMAPHHPDVAVIAQKFPQKRRMFLHILPLLQQDAALAKYVIPGLNAFLKAHPDYIVVTGFDGKSNVNLDPFQLEAVKNLQCDNIYHVKYTSAWGLCAILNAMDVVVTTKLHVGIVSASLGKPVVSFPLHPHKTKRFYEQIGEPGRCLLCREATAEQVTQMLDQYADQPIQIPKELRQLAAENLRLACTIAQDDDF